MRFCILQFQKIDDYVGIKAVLGLCNGPKIASDNKKKRYIGVDIAFFLEVPGGFEPPWLVLQTRD